MLSYRISCRTGNHFLVTASAKASIRNKMSKDSRVEAEWGNDNPTTGEALIQSASSSNRRFMTLTTRSSCFGVCLIYVIRAVK